MRKIAIVLGGTRGIGRALATSLATAWPARGAVYLTARRARQYADDGWAVMACTRTPDRATELHALAAAYPATVDVQATDVADGASVAALAARLAGRPIDLLVNNAGVGADEPSALGRIDYDRWRDVLATNTLGPVRVSEALLENVAASDRKLIVTLTTALGSLGLYAAEESPGFGALYPYRSSKAASDMATLALAKEVAPRGIIAVGLSPGWVRTAMGGSGATLSPAESVAGMRGVIAGLTPAQSGRALAHDGRPLPW